MGKILDNPKDYFDNMSDEEFLKLLDNMGIEYKDKDESKNF